MASPASTSTIRHGMKRAVLTRNWASAGLSSTKSSVPLRMCSTTLVRDGFTAPSSTPFMSVNQPITTSASSKVQPATPARSPKTTSSGTSDQQVQSNASAPCPRNSSRYWSDSAVEARSCTASRRR